ncbi:Nascent polypeptide associated complex NAC [Halovenus aranensis]|uniref:Nascent polypeptide-associated complex protein n=1 Tax=Halovenus aranensis TaxID=890420 RepID=A0A1G8T3Z5_9EURY|nr:nascent polypeptide-associated complex protein [Halovenus aranensis]SDJ36272.1 Nascent polypeptide associated complex NAC [Halovenus aranensis]
MFGGGGGLDPSKMQQMMKQMGIDIDELDAEEVIIRTSEEELVFTDADVQRMDAQGQQTYNIVGDPERRAAGETSDSAEEAQENEGIPQDDIELVAQRTGTSEDAAREALEATDGDLAAAVSRLE